MCMWMKGTKCFALFIIFKKSLIKCLQQKAYKNLCVCTYFKKIREYLQGVWRRSSVGVRFCGFEGVALLQFLEALVI